MKSSWFYITVYCLSLFLNINVNAQITYPYFQNFENNKFLNDSDIHLDVNGPPPLPREDINVTYGYDYAWSIEESPIRNSNSLKLTVHPDDHNKQALFPRSRSEIAISVSNYEPIYLNYKIYIPNDDEFKETIESDSYHIIQQFQADHYNRRSENSFIINDFDKYGNEILVSDLLGVLTLQYKEDDSTMRDLEFWTNDPKDIELHKYGELELIEYNRRRNRFKIINGLEKGKWNEIILKINFSQITEEGSYQYWINRQPIVMDSIGKPEYNEIYASPNPSLDLEPTKIKTGNIMLARDGKQMPMLVKLGHYRQNIPYDQSLYLDDFRIWHKFPPAFTTKENISKIIPEQCNQKAPNDLILIAYDDPNAYQYTFRFTNTKNGKIRVFESEGPAIDLRRFRILKGKKTYQVDVKTQGVFGDSCLINSLKVK